MIYELIDTMIRRGDALSTGVSRCIVPRIGYWNYLPQPIITTDSNSAAARKKTHEQAALETSPRAIAVYSTPEQGQ